GRGAARPRVERVAGAAPAEGRVTLPFGVGALGVAYPAVLAALLGLPLFFVGASRFRLAPAGRALAAALVVLALAGLSLERAHPAAGTCVVAAIDVSASVGSAARETAREFLARLVPALGARDTLGAVAFAGRTRVLARPVAGRARLDALVPGAALAVTVNGEALLPVPVELPPGVSAVRLPYRFENAGTYLLEATLLLAPGAPPAPGAVAAAITVTQPLRVLVVSERPQPVVALALVRRGMDVEVTAPAGLAARVGHLAEYHLVVLEDVARAGIPERPLDALARR